MDLDRYLTTILTNSTRGFLYLGRFRCHLFKTFSIIMIVSIVLVLDLALVDGRQIQGSRIFFGHRKLSDSSSVAAPISV